MAETERRKLNKLIKRASSVLDCPLDLTEQVGKERMLYKITSIRNNTSHPLHVTVRAVSSSFNNRLLLPQCRKERYSSSFLLAAMRLQNTTWAPILITHHHCYLLFHLHFIMFICCIYYFTSRTYLLAFVYSFLCIYSFITQLCNLQFSHSWDNRGYSFLFYSILFYSILTQVNSLSEWMQAHS